MVILSPRFPVRESTLILSCRNFSNAEGSKILSFVGADASRTYYVVSQELRDAAPCGIVSLRQVCLFSRESAYCILNSKATVSHRETYCLWSGSHLNGWGFGFGDNSLQARPKFNL